MDTKSGNVCNRHSGPLISELVVVFLSRNNLDLFLNAFLKECFYLCSSWLRISECCLHALTYLFLPTHS